MKTTLALFSIAAALVLLPSLVPFLHATLAAGTVDRRTDSCLLVAQSRTEFCDIYDLHCLYAPAVYGIEVCRR